MYAQSIALHFAKTFFLSVLNGAWIVLDDEEELDEASI
jgi:hypothetical protein